MARRAVFHLEDIEGYETGAKFGVGCRVKLLHISRTGSPGFEFQSVWKCVSRNICQELNLGDVRSGKEKGSLYKMVRPRQFL